MDDTHFVYTGGQAPPAIRLIIKSIEIKEGTEVIDVSVSSWACLVLSLGLGLGLGLGLALPCLVLYCVLLCNVSCPPVLHCLVLPCLVLPGLALRLALPCLVLPCLALSSSIPSLVHSFWLVTCRFLPGTYRSIT
jgi:hypothetical protein